MIVDPPVTTDDPTVDAPVVGGEPGVADGNPGEDGSGDDPIADTDTTTDPAPVPEVPARAIDVPSTLATGVTGFTFDTAALDVDRFTADNYQAALAAVIAMVRHDDVSRVLRDGYRLIERIESPSSGFTTLPISSGRVSEVLQCPAGGRVDITYPDSTNRLPGDFYEFGDCAVDGEVFNGVLFYSSTAGVIESVAAQSAVRTVGNAPLVLGITRSNGIRERATGLVSEQTAVDAQGKSAWYQPSQLLAYEYVTSSESARYNITGASYITSTIPDFEVSEPGQTLGLGRTQSVGTAAIELASQRRLVVGFMPGDNLPFVAPDLDSEFTVGQMTVYAQQNRLVMNAANGSPDSFAVTIFHSENIFQTFTVPWSDRFRFSRPGVPFD